MTLKVVAGQGILRLTPNRSLAARFTGESPRGVLGDNLPVTSNLSACSVTAKRLSLGGPGRAP